MDPCYIDIDGFGPKEADTKGPESAPVANKYYAHLEIGGRLIPKSNSGLGPASVVP
jgi:hypothetical protein